MLRTDRRGRGNPRGERARPATSRGRQRAETEERDSSGTRSMAVSKACQPRTQRPSEILVRVLALGGLCGEELIELLLLAPPGAVPRPRGCGFGSGLRGSLSSRFAV